MGKWIISQKNFRDSTGNLILPPAVMLADTELYNKCSELYNQSSGDLYEESLGYVTSRSELDSKIIEWAGVLPPLFNFDSISSYPIPICTIPETPPLETLFEFVPQCYTSATYQNSQNVYIDGSISTLKFYVQVNHLTSREYDTAVYAGQQYNYPDYIYGNVLVDIAKYGDRYPNRMYIASGCAIIPEESLVDGKVIFPCNFIFFQISSWPTNSNANAFDITSIKWSVNIRKPNNGIVDATVFSNLYGEDYKVENSGDIPPEPERPPYEGGGISGTGGGGGNFDDTSDPIPVPSLPSLSAVNTGFITLYNPTLSQLQNLADYMWADPAFDLTTLRKLYADPMDIILGLSIVPFPVPNGGTTDVKVGNISTGVSMTKASSQYVEVDCGKINVDEYWGAYLDYSPYTKAELYLPFVGMRAINVDDIMGKQLGVVYHFDILSGSCVAFVTIDDNVLYTYVGQCSSSIPISGNDWTNVVNGAISIAGAIGTTVATGGMTAPIAAGTIASTAVNSMKPEIERSGGMSGTGSILAVGYPYLVLTRPNQALPENQNTYIGYPSYITANLGSLSGFTIVEEIHLEGIPATSAELNEIESLLKEGVII